MKIKWWLCLTALLLILCACGQKTVEEQWQEQYDLGVRFLSEGKYEEAVIAFTAAIEIDPKQAEAYVALADVYVEQGQYEQAKQILSQGLTAVEETAGLAEKLAEVEAVLVSYRPPMTNGDEKAEEPSTNHSVKIQIGDTEFIVSEIEANQQQSESKTEPEPEPKPEPRPKEEELRTERQDQADGSYYMLTVNASNRVVRWIFHRADGSIVLDYTAESGNYLTYTVSSNGFRVYEWNSESNRMVRERRFDSAGVQTYQEEHEYNASGREIRWRYYTSDGSRVVMDYTAEEGNYLTYTVSSNGFRVYEWSSESTRLVRERRFDSAGVQTYQEEHEYNASGREIRWRYYTSDGSRVVMDYTAEAGNYLTYTVSSNGFRVCEWNSESNRMVRERRFDSAGVQTYQEEHEYNASGSEIRWRYYTSDGSRAVMDYTAEAGNYLTYTVSSNGFRVYEWNSESNRMVRERRFDSAGVQTYQEEHEYNASGREIRWRYYTSDGSRVVMDYTAEAGNYLTYTVRSNGFRVYEWDSKSTRLVRERRFDSAGVQTYQEEHEYDADGREIRWRYYTPDGSAVIMDYTAETGNYLSYTVSSNGFRVYEWNGANQCVRTSKFDGSGTLLSVE